MSLIESALQKARGQLTEQRPQPRIPTQLAPQPNQDLRLMTVDIPRLRSAELVPAERDVNTFREVFRRIKRPLIAEARKAAGATRVRSNIVMVASGMPAEGKTFIALNLAISIAQEHGIDVLLVDGDVAKQGLSTALGMSGQPGLLDTIQDPQASLEAAVVRTDVNGLFFLPAGTARQSATELLSGQRCRQVFERLEAWKESVIVVVDSPPLMLSNEARALAELAGQVLLVVREGVTLQSTLTESLRIVQNNALVSLVLNQSMHSPASPYGSDYPTTAE